MWQAKEALKSCTVGAVRIAIIQSVRGEVWEFTAAIGFEESVETLLDKVEDRFGEKWTAQHRNEGNLIEGQICCFERGINWDPGTEEED